MRILHICPIFHPSIGGIEKFVLDLVSASRRCGVDARVLTLNHIHGIGRLPDRDTVNGVPVERVPFLDFRFYKPALLPVSRLRWADVLHVHGANAQLDFTAAIHALHHRPIVASTHGGIFHTRSLIRLKKTYFLRLQRPTHRRVACYVACSRSDMELFRPVSSRLVLIENGVGLSAYAQPPAKRDLRLFLSLNRLARHKRVDRIIRVCSSLHAMGVDFQLRVVGADTEGLLPALMELARAGGIEKQVAFTGEVPQSQLEDEYRRAAFYLSASEYEGFGIAAVEGMAAGCVPILQDNSAFRQLLADGRNGFIVNYADTEATARRIAGIVATDTAPIRSAARQRGWEFSWDAKLPLWMKVYAAAMTHGAPPAELLA